MKNRFGLPYLGFGLGLRPDHYPDILDKWPAVDWFEVISENFMDTDGRPRRILERVIEHYPVVMHGVSLSVGSTDPLNKDYLEKLKTLAEWVNPPWISDHLCWTGVHEKNSHDLLPVPYTDISLSLIVDRIKQVQDYLGRPILLENPSTYLEFRESIIPEWEFIAMMAERADCGLLLDVNNVYVSCYNHRLDAKTYIDAIPADRVVQIHLAGHENQGTHIVDTHDGYVVDPVWELYSYAVSRIGPVSTMIEWDAKIPAFSVMLEELEKAKTYAERHIALPSQHLHNYREGGDTPQTQYPIILSRMQESILSGDITQAEPEQWIRAKKDYSPAAQLEVYVNGYRYRLFDVISDDLKVTRHALGDEAMDTAIWQYIEQTPSTYFNIARYILGFPEFLKGRVPAFAVELVTLETVLTQVFDMTETPILDPEVFSQIAPETFFEQVLPLRQASRLLAFEYPVNQYYSDVHEKKNPSIPKPQASYLIVYRHDDTVWRMNLVHEEYLLLQALAAGDTVGDAINGILAALPESEATLMTELQEWFSKWLRNGILAAVRIKDMAA